MLVPSAELRRWAPLRCLPEDAVHEPPHRLSTVGACQLDPLGDGHPGRRGRSVAPRLWPQRSSARSIRARPDDRILRAPAGDLGVDRRRGARRRRATSSRASAAAVRVALRLGEVALEDGVRRALPEVGLEHRASASRRQPRPTGVPPVRSLARSASDAIDQDGDRRRAPGRAGARRSRADGRRGPGPSAGPSGWPRPGDEAHGRTSTRLVADADRTGRPAEDGRASAARRARRERRRAPRARPGATSSAMTPAPDGQLRTVTGSPPRSSPARPRLPGLVERRRRRAPRRSAPGRASGPSSPPRRTA